MHPPDAEFMALSGLAMKNWTCQSQILKAWVLALALPWLTGRQACTELRGPGRLSPSRCLLSLSKPAETMAFNGAQILGDRMHVYSF